MSLEVRYPRGPLEQSTTEERAYIIDVIEWTDVPSTPVVDAVYDESDGSDVTTTVMPANNPSVTNTLITLSKLQSLILGRFYRIEVHFTGENGDRLECHLRVHCSHSST